MTLVQPCTSAVTASVVADLLVVLRAATPGWCAVTGSAMRVCAPVMYAMRCCT